MSNQRRIRRALAAGLVGVSAAPLVAVDSAGAAPAVPAVPAAPAQAVPAPDPILWEGEVPGATPDSMVVAHGQSTGRDLADEGDVGAVRPLGHVGADDDGVFRIRATPGPWYQELADADGRVQVLLTASADGGAQIGLGLVYVRWEADALEPGGGSWVADAEPAESGVEGSGRAAAAPTSAIVMSPAPAEVAASVAAYRSSVGQRAAPSYPTGFHCYGERVHTGSTNNWIKLGKYYHAGVGPSETFTYQTTRTTSTEWGYKVGAGYGAFTASGRVTMSRGTSSSSMAGSTIAPNGQDRLLHLVVDVEYRRYRNRSCFYDDQPPTGSGTGGFDVNTMAPYRWNGNALLFGGEGTPPPNSTYVTRYLVPGQWIGRESGRTTTNSSAGEVAVGSASLTASVSYTTTSGSGTTVGRRWTNNHSTTKYIRGMGGDPQRTGVRSVYATG